MFTGYPGQVRLPVLLCRQGKPWAILLVQMPLLGRPVGWATQLSVFSGKVPWSDKLKAVFSNESGYDLVSLRKLI